MNFNSMRMLSGSGAPLIGEGSPIAGQLLRSLGALGDLSIPHLRALSPLSDKAQIMVDNAVVEVGLERLTFVQDLMSEGLVYNLPDPLSVPVLEWESVNKIGSAIRSMSPSARGENQLIQRVVKRLPIYCTMDDFSVGIRTLKASQRMGTPLDVTQVKQAARRVNEALEDAAINGATTIDGVALQVPVGTDDNGNAITGTVPGLLTAPNANTGNGSVDWTAANVIGTTGPAMQADVLTAAAALAADKKFGPYNLYVGTNAGVTMQGQFAATATFGTIQTMLEAMQFGGRNLRVRVADRMPNVATSGTKQFALVQMTEDVVQLVQGQVPTVIPWTSLDGFTLYWLVMAIAVPRVRSDYDGNSGVYIGTKS